MDESVEARGLPSLKRYAVCFGRSTYHLAETFSCRFKSSSIDLQPPLKFRERAMISVVFPEDGVPFVGQSLVEHLPPAE